MAEKGKDRLSPVVLATELTAWMNSGALFSEYSTNTSSSFRAVFTTKRDWGKRQFTSGAWTRLLVPGGRGRAPGAKPKEKGLGRKTQVLGLCLKVHLVFKGPQAYSNPFYFVQGETEGNTRGRVHMFV